MSNPYRAPTAPLPIPSSSGRPALIVVGVICAILPALIATLIVPSFAQMFTAFGADTPWPTRLLLRAYPALWLLPLLVLAVWRFWPKLQKRGPAACWTGILILVLVLPACMVALYAPIFALGQPI